MLASRTRGRKMNIDSARALKEEIASKVIPPAVSAIQKAGGFSITTFSLDRMTKAEPLVALGIAQGTRHDDVRVAVRLQRRSLEHSQSMIERIRKRARNEVDVRFVGRIAKHALPWYRARQRPLLPGASVGHFKITAGTIGAIAREKKTGRDVILSNNHVLANENAAKIGDAILQAGVEDGGSLGRDKVAKLFKWIDLVTNRANMVDAAIAPIAKSIDLDAITYKGIGKLGGTRTAPVLPGMAVKKLGRTTGLTHGKVSAIEVDDVVVDYDLGSLSFDNQIEIESVGRSSFSAGGDSGSLILDEENLGCALFAGSERGGPNDRGLTYANPIATVLKRLAIELHKA
jgi:hypothetical protein